MTKADKPSDLSEAALALDHELRRFEDLAGQAAQVKLNTEKNLERATEALSRAADGHLVGALHLRHPGEDEHQLNLRVERVPVLHDRRPGEALEDR